MALTIEFIVKALIYRSQLKSLKNNHLGCFLGWRQMPKVQRMPDIQCLAKLKLTYRTFINMPILISTQ